MNTKRRCISNNEYIVHLIIIHGNIFSYCRLNYGTSILAKMNFYDQIRIFLSFNIILLYYNNNSDKNKLQLLSFKTTEIAKYLI